MIIAQKDRIIFVTLQDGEFLPDNLNSVKVCVFRQGDSTNRELKMIKPLGELASEEILRPVPEPVCLYNGDGNPLHVHKDGSWWYWDETWAYENGPFETEGEAQISLELYCDTVLAERNSLTKPQPSETVNHGQENEITTPESSS